MTTLSLESLTVGSWKPETMWRIRGGVGRHPAAAATKEFLNVYSQMGTSYVTTMQVHVNNDGPSVTEIIRIYSELAVEERTRLRAECRVIQPRQRTEFQRRFMALIADESLLNGAVPARVGVIREVEAQRLNIMMPTAFVGLRELIGRRWTRDGEVIISYWDYINTPNLYRKFAAVVLGAPELGKTPLARSTAYTWAVGFAIASGERTSEAFYSRLRTQSP